MVSIENVYAQIREFAAAAGVDKVVLFGSRTKRDGAAQKRYRSCCIVNAFEDHLQNDLWSLLKLDVINLDEPISESLRREIEHSGKCIVLGRS